jgi:hypothetical protein
VAIVFACSCGRQITVNDSAAGKRVRCKVCDAVLTIPPAGGAPVVTGDPDDLPGPTPGMAVSRAPVPAAYDDEPWYYTALTLLTGSVAVISIGVFVVIVLLAKVPSISSDEAANAANQAWAWSILTPCLASAVSATIVWLACLVGVDAARQLRRK